MVLAADDVDRFQIEPNTRFLFISVNCRIIPARKLWLEGKNRASALIVLIRRSRLSLMARKVLLCGVFYPRRLATGGKRKSFPVIKHPLLCLLTKYMTQRNICETGNDVYSAQKLPEFTVVYRKKETIKPKYFLL